MTDSTLAAVRTRVEGQLKKVREDPDYIADQAHVHTEPATALRQMWLLGRNFELKTLLDLLNGKTGLREELD